jgi:hypothetical protein
VVKQGGRDAYRGMEAEVGTEKLRDRQPDRTDRKVEAASRGREADTQEDRQSGADGSRQPHKNREIEAEIGRQSRTPLWVEVGRIILAKGSHAGVGRQTDRPMQEKIE